MYTQLRSQDPSVDLAIDFAVNPNTKPWAAEAAFAPQSVGGAACAERQGTHRHSMQYDSIFGYATG